MDGQCTIHRRAGAPTGVPGFHERDARRVLAAGLALRGGIPSPEYRNIKPLFTWHPLRCLPVPRPCLPAPPGNHPQLARAPARQPCRQLAAPQLFRTGRPEARAPGNSRVLSLTHPAPPVQTARSRASPGCVLRWHAAAACWGRRPRRARAAAAGAGGPEASGGSGGGKCLLNLLSVTVVNAKTGKQLSHNSSITNHPTAQHVLLARRRDDAVPQREGLQLGRRLLCAGDGALAGQDHAVAYPTLADILSRPLPSHLRRLTQPVVSPSHRFSPPRLPCLACLSTH
jgi:hypothetical protein